MKHLCKDRDLLERGIKPNKDPKMPHQCFSFHIYDDGSIHCADCCKYAGAIREDIENCLELNEP